MRVLFIHGFLGSGKTTVINHILNEYCELKIGVLVNEFAGISVDDLNVSSQANQIKTVVGGSLFCSCKSRELIDSLLKLLDEDLDLILVEASGFADPPLSELPVEVYTTKEETIKCYHLTVVEGHTFTKLLTTLNLVKRQVEVADLLVLNKIDLLEAKQQEELCNLLRQLSSVPIHCVSYGLVGRILENLSSKQSFTVEPEEERDLSLSSLILDVPVDCSLVKIEEYMSLIAERVYRIKGKLTLKEGNKDCQLAGGKISITDSSSVQNKLVILYSTREIREKELRELYQRIIKS